MFSETHISICFILQNVLNNLALKFFQACSFAQQCSNKDYTVGKQPNVPEVAVVSTLTCRTYVAVTS